MEFPWYISSLNLLDETDLYLCRYIGDFLIKEAGPVLSEDEAELTLTDDEIYSNPNITFTLDTKVSLIL